MRINTVAILGLGIFGKTVADKLSNYDCDVIVIDQSADKIEPIADQVTSAVIGDFTDPDLLQSTGVGNCDLVIVATGGSLESAILAVVYCRRLGVQTIIAKARCEINEAILYELGVDTVISPERDSAFRLANRILSNKIEEVLPLDEETSIVEFSVPEAWVGKPLIELDLRNKYNMNVLGSRKERSGHITPVLADQILEADLHLVAMVHTHLFERYDYLGYFD